MKIRTITLCLAAILPFLIPSLSLAADPVYSAWVEGEAADLRSVQRNGWYESVKTEELSGGGWVAHWGKTAGTASYQVELPKTANYVLWMRTNPVGTKLRVRFDGGDWQDVDTGGNKRETINVAADNKIDLRFVAWVRAGARELSAGEHQVEVRFESDNNHHGALDCFCLTSDEEWTPRRDLRPGEAIPDWPAPEINAENLDQWISFLRPAADELTWQAVRWHHSLSEAAAEARKLNRPVLLWAMNGHPCGET